MPPRGRKDRQPGETDEQYAARLENRAELVHQVREEVRFAAAGQNMTLRAVAQAMGDQRGVALSSNAGAAYSLAKIADIGFAMGVEFRLVAIPRDRSVNAVGSRPKYGRKFTPEQVVQIRLRAAAGESQRSIAESLGVVQSLIFDVVHRRSYNDVA